MKKFRFTLVLIIACLLLVGLLTACGGNNNNSSTPSNNIRSLMIGESATNCSNALSCSYDYGEDISSIKNLKFFFVYSNNSKQELTADQVKKVQFSLTLSDDTKITTIDSSLSLDVGSYVVTCTYETHMATINLTILPIDADSSEYSFEVKNASNGTVAESLKFGSSIIGDTMTSPYTISIKKGSEYVNKTQLAEIYYITPAEYTEYSALTNASDKKEFLATHEIVTIDDQTIIRTITYNRDSKTDTEFYAYLNDFNLKPGTYYLFANINASGNY
ncbi:MAG: hypothetical protein K5765_09570, partial [Clostridia bacterium]|nr:hypothetical protein [Clostridia bacterium]